MEKKKTRKNRKAYGPKNRPEGNNFSKSKKTGGRRQEAEGRTPARKVTVKPGPMLYPLPSVMVSCGTMENSNIITVGWTGIVNTDPPMTYVSIRKSRFSHQIIRETGEFVINLTSADLTRWCDYCGVKSGRNVDKFKETGLTKEKCQVVRAPMIAESPLNLECVVKEVKELPSHDMFLAEIVSVHIDERLIDEKGKYQFENMDLTAYCHGEYFSLNRKPLGFFGYSVMKPKTRKKLKGKRRP